MSWFDQENLQTPAGEAENAREFFDFFESIFDQFGFDTAADNLRYYRSGVGGVRTYSREEMSSHPAYGEAIDANRTRFEANTFTGRTKNDTLNGRLLGLQDGETYSFKDNWKSGFTFSQPSTYMAFGRSGIFSEGDFKAYRRGDRLYIQGTVQNRLGSEAKNKEADRETEAFDFNPGQIGYRQGQALEDVGEANPFGMDYRTQQSIEAEMQYEPDGNLVLLRSTWGAEE